MQQQSVNLTLLYPELVLSITIGLVVVVDLFVGERRKAIGFWISLIGVLVSLVYVCAQRGWDLSTFDGSYVINNFTTLAKAFFLLTAVAILMLSKRYIKDDGLAQGEYYFLILTAFLGCLLMPSVRDLLMVFIAIELVSVPGFIMASFRKRDPRSNEAGLKFFLIGVLSSAVMLYGMSLVYGLAGTLNLAGISTALAGRGGEPIVILALVFVVAGFAFKVSAVPFHFWAPDTYEGSPVPVTAFLSVASKAAGFTGLLIMMFVGFGSLATTWAPLFAALAVMTILFGNLVALRQVQVVRMLAYSSIAQAGYMLVPFAVAGTSAAQNAEAFRGVFFYVMVYGITTLGIFAVVIAVSKETPSLLLKDFNGLVTRAPWLGVALVTFLLSLAGMPLTAGFFGKVFLVLPAISNGAAYAYALAVVLFIGSVISIGYYFKLIKQSTLRDPAHRTKMRVPWMVTAVAAAAMIFTIAIGVLPGVVLHYTNLVSP